MKQAVIERGEVIYVGEDAWQVRLSRIKTHKEHLAQGSWNAFWNPQSAIRIADTFQATGQYLHNVNTLWLYIENTPWALDMLNEEKQYVIDKRKTLRGRANMALDRGRIVLNKIWKSLYWSKDWDSDVFQFPNSTAFSRVFANYVTDYESNKVKQLLESPTGNFNLERLTL